MENPQTYLRRSWRWIGSALDVRDLWDIIVPAGAAASLSAWVISVMQSWWLGAPVVSRVLAVIGLLLLLIATTGYLWRKLRGIFRDDWHEDDVIRDRILHPSDVADDKDRISHKVFKNCEIRGPAVLQLDPPLPFQRCTADDGSYLVTPPFTTWTQGTGLDRGDTNRLEGSILVTDTTFADCDFRRIGFIGLTSDMKEMAELLKLFDAPPGLGFVRTDQPPREDSSRGGL